MTFTIPGAPISASSDKVVVRGGKVYRYPAERVSEYLSKIRSSWRAAALPSLAPDAPIAMTIVVHFHIPASTGKKQRELMARGFHLPVRRPAADGIADLVCTALSGLAFQDERQIVRLEVVKRYTSDPPCVTVTLRRLG